MVAKVAVQMSAGVEGQAFPVRLTFSQWKPKLKCGRFQSEPGNCDGRAAKQP